MALKEWNIKLIQVVIIRDIDETERSNLKARSCSNRPKRSLTSAKKTVPRVGAYDDDLIYYKNNWLYFSCLLTV